MRPSDEKEAAGARPCCVLFVQAAACAPPLLAYCLLVSSPSFQNFHTAHPSSYQIMDFPRSSDLWGRLIDRSIEKQDARWALSPPFPSELSIGFRPFARLASR